MKLETKRTRNEKLGDFQCVRVSASNKYCHCLQERERAAIFEANIVTFYAAVWSFWGMRIWYGKLSIEIIQIFSSDSVIKNFTVYLKKPSKNLDHAWIISWILESYTKSKKIIKNNWSKTKKSTSLKQLNILTKLLYLREPYKKAN